jgi:valyl-tRNA synthetase
LLTNQPNYLLICCFSARLRWEGQGLYKPDENDEKKEKFVMVIPPPNVTGTLHLGHALMGSIQDCIVRYHRMQGKSTLWLPGTDHAGIATQSVVEKKIARELNKTRHDLGREAFIAEVWKWKEKSGNRIYDQFRRLGVSVDWSRDCFTMDSKLSAAVKEAFIRLHKQGLIYRANRIVSWCCSLRTAISSIEVDTTEFETPTLVKIPGYNKPVEVGVIHSFAYKLADGSGEIIVATTRIETMLGDVAVAVNSRDERYQQLIGKKLIHPFVAGREIKIIADDVLVDMNFGTGAVKVTPAHDPNDFKCGERNNLEFITIFTDDGLLNDNAGPLFAGKKRFDVREEIIIELTKLGLYKGKAANKMAIGFCSRSKDIIEPIIKPQWWVNCKDLAAKSVEAVRSKELELIPSEFDRVWYQWLENIQDWCISRQLWWGHRIPAFRISFKNNPASREIDDEKHWIVANDQAEALKLAAQRFPDANLADIELRQDEDVLDTWFSSGLFPFSTMGWPNEQSPDFQRYFPGTLLETGHDILFFWVARMVMMSIALTGKLPFNYVYLHALVRDKLGRKMSKSLGNIIDPLDVITGITLEELHDQLRSSNLDPKEIEKAIDGQKKDFPDGIGKIKLHNSNFLSTDSIYRTCLEQSIRRSFS